jgi:hypothetical protein
MTSAVSFPKSAAVAAIVPLVESEIAQVSSFIAAESGQTPGTVEAHLRWFLLENPARRSQQPLGYGLFAFDNLVGCILCSPQKFQFHSEQFLMMGSSSFYVAQSHRGHGGRIFLQYSRLANQWPLFGTSANPLAAALWKAAGATPIPFSDGELFGVLNWPPVAEEFVHRRNSNPLLSRIAGSSISKLAAIFSPLKLTPQATTALHLLTSAEQVRDVLANTAAEKLTALRDPAYIRWRYFSGKDATAAVFVFRSIHPDRDIIVTVNQRPRGHRNQINTLNILDVYPEVSSKEWLRIASALIAKYSGTVDALVLRNQGEEQRNFFLKHGFRWRAFDASNGWLLDKANILPGSGFYIVPADGDGLI